MNSKDGNALSARHPLSEGVKRLNPALFGSNPPAAQLPATTTVPRATEAGQGSGKKPQRATEHTIKLNGTEQRMRDWLDAMVRTGKFKSHKALAIRLRHSIDEKGHYQTYTPDFVVTENDGTLTMIEVKGAHIRTKDVTRFKSCRADWPQFRFEMWRWADRQWAKVL